MGGKDFKGGTGTTGPPLAPALVCSKEAQAGHLRSKLEMLRSFKYILLTQEFDAQSLEILSLMNTCDESIFGIQIG